MSIEDELPPFGTEDEFAEAVGGMVTESAPRLFAVVQELGVRVDARIAGWGLAHSDHVDVIGEGSVHRGASPQPEDMLRYFQRPDQITARIVWPNPADAGGSIP